MAPQLRTIARVHILSLALCLLCACVSKQPAGADPASAAPVIEVPEPAPPPTNESEAQVELDILEAVYRYQFTHNASSATYHGRVEVYFLSAPGRKDPPSELMARFADHTPAVERVSAANPNVWNGVKHKADGRQGIILEVDEIHLIDADTARVNGGYYEMNRSSSENTYLVKRQSAAWVVARDRLNGMS